MRIAIDLTALNPKPSGIDRYLIGMVRSLARLETGAQFFIFINAEDRPLFSAPHELPKNFHLLPICFRPRLVRLFFQQFLLPLLLLVLRVDVLHSPTFIMPLWRAGARHVLTIHDMSSFVLPQSHPPIRRGALYELVVSTSIRRADCVTVPSASVQRDILRFVEGVEADRVWVIPCGINRTFRPCDVTEVRTVLQRYQISQPYILFVGMLDPRKNLTTLIEAFADVIKAGRQEQLVLAGPRGWLPNESLSEGLRRCVHFPGYIAEEDLPFLYSGAALFVYPSLLEGFGFPPLEAMASGVPVIASDSSSLRENLLGAATLVPPHDSKQLSAAILKLLSDESARGHAITAGLERSRSFSWESFAEATFACYANVKNRRQ